MPFPARTGWPEAFRKHGQVARQHQEIWMERLGLDGSGGTGPDGPRFPAGGRPAGVRFSYGSALPPS
ncbi:hypothetical protein FRAAL6203 [Frankia alni ACN14a]|uniref:Uncharacterized protein n=1 Tax=Frankia alni (strain DSM 45986 / CECT 9034 / ACN14a) TaxID=326424 RepID=Q0RCJ8_FRAAA|nr:hypothetical protein FRAAL6203 [Frankia alni ACN14a]